MTRERYESISLHDLREIAKNRGMRRISTLKKADLIDAMLKKDEEEAILLRNERIQRRQMQEAAQGAQDGVRQARDEAGGAGGKEAEDVTGTSRSADGQDGAGQESAARTEGDNPPRQRSGNDRQGQENTAAGPSDYDRKDKSAAGDSSRVRQRSKGVQRGRQGAGNYNSGTGTG
ncbi:MAG: Rho termination factor N-terminal domain-containing protein, partial [Lachnospiraceae bacterium]|nr:Rho termination factor N-terminal domain-containing protein [Lachnospiraceae bacterium]